MEENISHIEKTIIDYLELQLRDNPYKTALICDEYKISYLELAQTANQISCWLYEKKVNKGDRVIIIGHNDNWKIISSIFGCLCLGIIFIPVHPEIGIHKFNNIILDCEPKAIILDSSLVQKYMEFFTAKELENILILPPNNITISEETAPNLTSELVQYYGEITEEDIAIIIYTSGSTNTPKGIIERHKQIVFVTEAINQVIQNTYEDIILCGIPLSFDYGLYQIFLAFSVGATVVLTRGFSLPMCIPQILSEHNITGFPGVPSLFNLLIRSRLLERINLPKLRYITSTSDVFPLINIMKLKKLLPHVDIYPMYGLTECKRVSILPKECLFTHSSSVGLPIPGTRVSIVDELGSELPNGQVGELIVEGKHVMSGYWNDIEETNRKFCFHEEETAKLRTGDYFKRDNEGFLYFEGRKETFIKTNGEKISPFEIENFLYKIDGVKEAVVVGIPDLHFGESVCFIISSNHETEVFTKKVREICQLNLSPSERPRHIYIQKELLQKNLNGKIDRKSIRKMIIDQKKALVDS